MLPVILYHAGFQSFSGGFVGVDVFFVISGYLITSIILAELQQGKFSLAGFYERRARRILPALFVVMATCVAVAWFHFLPEKMKAFGQGITASAAFGANIYAYLKNDDYFGLQSESNPILHLWSLALEEQYYVFFPLLLMAGWRIRKRSIIGIVAILAVASLAGAMWGIARHPNATFYLLPTRAWELLIGSLVAMALMGRPVIAGSNSLREVLSATGLSLIVIAVAVYDRATPFPSAYALLPTVGTALVIVFSDERTLTGRMLGGKIPVGIGLVSYSAYLWHQPLFAFYRELSPAEPSVPILLLLSAASLVLAYVTWHFVEKPFRTKGALTRGYIFGASAIISGAFMLFGIVGHFNSGYPDRDPLFGRLASNFGLSLSCNGNYSINSTCATSATPETAIFGNSFAMHLVEGYRSAYPGTSLVQITQDSCEPHFGERRHLAGKLSCEEFLTRAMATITTTHAIKKVIISSPFTDLLVEENSRAFERTIHTLRLAGKEVEIVGPTPAIGVDFGKCLLRQSRSGAFIQCDFNRDRIRPIHFEIVDSLRAISRRQGAVFIDLTELICDQNRCHSSVGDVFIYRDGGHLSREGSRYIFSLIRAQDVANSAN